MNDTNPTKTGYELKCTGGRVIRSCPTSGTRRISLVKTVIEVTYRNPMFHLLTDIFTIEIHSYYIICNYILSLFFVVYEIVFRSE